MDWEIVFAGGTFGIALAGAISTFMWLVIKLVTAPMGRDIKEMKEQLNGIVPMVKSERDLQVMIDFAIAKHKENCLKKIKETTK